jgi:hypothetical protein
MGRQDAHAVAFDAGDTDFQLVASAQTWIARPTLTEAECHALEPDEDTFRREYACIPFDGSAASLFGESALLAVTRRGPVSLPAQPGVVYFAAEDAASRANGWTVVAGYGRQVADDMCSIVVVGAREWRAPRGGALDTDAVYREIAEFLGDWNVRDLWTDQWSFDSRLAVARRHGLTLELETATQSSKVQVAEAFRRRVTDRLIELPDVSAIRQDLLGVRKWIGKGGAFSIELERIGGRHCDFAPALFLLAAKVFAEDSAMPAWVRPGAVRHMAQAFGGGFDARSLGSRATSPFADDAPEPPLKHRVSASGEHELTGSAEVWPSRFMAVFAPGQPARHGRETRQWGEAEFTKWQRAVEAWRSTNGV